MKKILLQLLLFIFPIFVNISCNSSNYQENDNFQLLWSRQVGDYGGYTYGLAIANDYNDNIYVTGSTNVGISGELKQGNWDFFIVKYDKYGNKIWTNELGKPLNNAYGRAVSADKLGNIYVSGMTKQNIFGESQMGFDDYFIAKYQPNGNKLWSRQVGTLKHSAVSFGIIADKLGNIYLSGNTTGGLSGESQNGIVDYFIAKYNESGDILWTRQVGKYGESTFGEKITTDYKRNIYLTGYTSAALSDGIKHGRYDYFIAKYNESGDMLWTKQVGNESGETKGIGVSTDMNGNIYLVGYTTVGISGYLQHGRYDYFIAKYNESGNMLWTRQVGASGGDTLGLSIVAGLNGVYIVGRTTVNLFGLKQLGSIDYFIAKYNESGDFLYGKQVGAKDGKVMGVGITIGNDGYIYTTGYTDVGLFGQSQIGGIDYLVTKWR